VWLDAGLLPPLGVNADAVAAAAAAEAAAAATAATAADMPFALAECCATTEAGGGAEEEETGGIAGAAAASAGVTSVEFVFMEDDDDLREKEGMAGMANRINSCVGLCGTGIDFLHEVHKSKSSQTEQCQRSPINGEVSQKSHWK
jgi:hypothetical protein